MFYIHHIFFVSDADRPGLFENMKNAINLRNDDTKRTEDNSKTTPTGYSNL
jgi:hypothetical protein